MFLTKEQTNLMVNHSPLASMPGFHSWSPATEITYHFHVLGLHHDGHRTKVLYCFRTSSFLGSILILIIIIAFYHVPEKMTTFKINLQSLVLNKDFYLQ